MIDRIAFEQASNPLIEFVNTSPESFGGAWFDHPNGGVRLWLAVAADATEDFERALTMVPVGLELRILPVEFSLAQLREGQEAIRGREKEIGITGTYIDITTNELVVGGTVGKAAELAADLGVPVRAEPIALVPVGCNSRAACTPYRAAINADFPNELCTWGFIAKTNLIEQLNIISAGHCATISQWAKHNGTKVSNYVNRNTFDMLSNQQADALRGALVQSVRLTEPYNLLYNTDTFKNLPLDSKESLITQTVGETACFVGRTNGNRCGQIHALGISDWVDRFEGTSQLFYNLVRMNRSTSGGDSGAPVRYGYTALGMVAFADLSFDHYAVYAAIDKVENSMDVKICITSGCNL